ncbi:MAG: ATP-binding protein [Acidimicrobiales bacterium]
MVTEDEVRLSIPAIPEFLRLARLTATGLADRLSFSYDEVEDLRLAVDEMAYALLGPDAQGGVLELSYVAGPESLEVTGELIGAGPAGRGNGKGKGSTAGSDVGLSEWSGQIMEALVDEYRLDSDGPNGQPMFRFVKRHHAGAGGTATTAGLGGDAGSEAEGD